MIKNPEGDTIIALEVQNDITIRELNEKYCQIRGFMKRKFRFRFVDKILNYEKKLSDYEIEDGDMIYANGAIMGGGPTRDNPGPTHVCPYGCGRQIPEDFKGCTELLKAIPDFFD